MSAAFYNTTSLKGEELRAAIVAAKDQNAAILAIYSASSAALSPSDVWRLCERAGKRWPLTSVRRAISTLSMGDGAPLQKTDCQILGIYNRPEYLWARAA